MSLIDIFRIGAIKKALAASQQECAELRAIVAETDRMDHHQLKQAVAELRQKKDILATELQSAQADIFNRKNEIIVLDEQILLQSFGLYKPRYGSENSDAYEAKLEEIRNRQTEMVKAGTAAACPTNWTVNDSKVEGRRMIRDYTKLIVRSFNNECDASIVRVKFSNLDVIDKKIIKAFELLNKLGARMSISLSEAYLNLKLEELHLVHEYQVKKQEEKEEQKRIRAQMREEARVMREIEEMKENLEKEEKHFSKALETLALRLGRATTEVERTVLEEERSELLGKLGEVERAKADVLYREQNTRAGYVYIVSNIGSFGEQIFKIGVTRRLDPMERIDELGDASVPFDFDVHAMIFSDDAPSLENALHKAFAESRLNRINLRREFFRVSLQEIEAIIRDNFNKPVEFTRIAEAAQFRQSQLLTRPITAAAE